MAYQTHKEELAKNRPLKACIFLQSVYSSKEEDSPPKYVGLCSSNSLATLDEVPGI